jgi:hypothetical protein
MKKPHEDPNCPCEGRAGGVLTISSQNSPTIGLQPRNISFYFTLPDQPVPILQFCEDGKVFVRGEQVDDNLQIYAAVRTFFERSTYCAACGKNRNQEG